MMNKERMEKLNQAGINTSKYFTVDLDNGTKIHLIIDENGQPVVVNNKKDEIAEQIIADGYVRNTKLHRRFVMAQMFHMLNYVSYDKKESGYNAFLKKHYGYHYTLTMMLDEVKVLYKLEQRDKESFHERSHFFTKSVVIAVLDDYIDKLEKYIDTLPDRKCKGVPYKRIKGENIFNADLDKKLYAPLRRKLDRVRSSRNYATIYLYVKDFMKDMIKLPYNTPKSKVWIDAYKGEGAYYTLKNLVMFHDCFVVDGNSVIEDTYCAMKFLNYKLDEYKGEGWRMFALMKKVIADNNFNFNDRMKEIYSEK
jgi:hypothetical protein